MMILAVRRGQEAHKPSERESCERISVIVSLTQNKEERFGYSSTCTLLLAHEGAVHNACLHALYKENTMDLGIAMMSG
jgi:hypothetical protein